MITLASSPLDFPMEYYYEMSLLVAAAVNLLLAGLLVFDPDNYMYSSAPRYMRSRRLTALSLAVFGIGFFLHWCFMTKFTNPLSATMLSLSYFHIGGVLFSMSHTGFIDRHYFSRRVVGRDVTVLAISLCVYGLCVWYDSRLLLWIGSVLFYLHIGLLTFLFYRSYYRVHKRLGDYAEYSPNNSDHDINWMEISCHLIILFGIGSIVVTLLFPKDMLPFIILLFVGMGVFAYIYKALDAFGVLAYETEENLVKSEKYEQVVESESNSDAENEEKSSENDGFTAVIPERNESNDEMVKKALQEWVSTGKYLQHDITISNVVADTRIRRGRLTDYLNNVEGCSFRQWLMGLRFESACQMIRQQPQTRIDNIADACGITRSYLHIIFRERVGMTPSEWKSKNLN